MADEQLTDKDPSHPCPLCKQEGANVLFLQLSQIQKQLTKVQQSAILSLPKTIEVLLITTEQYVCRTCGIGYEKFLKEQTVVGAAKYMDPQGREINPSALGAGR